MLDGNQTLHWSIQGYFFKEFPEESLSQNKGKFHLLMEVYFSIDIKER